MLEVGIIALVALVVIGPERLPGVARTVGLLLGRAQRYANDVKADIRRELDLEEIRRIKATFYDAANSVEQSVNRISNSPRC
jgi:sec-independent protein translocase protein TatB